MGRDPRGWLRAQLDRAVGAPDALAGLATSDATLRELVAARRRGDAARKGLQKAWRRTRLPAERGARTLAAVQSERPFRERLVTFWSDHFAVSVARTEVAGGRVHADWPGLSAAARHDGRDLRPTTDLRAVLKGVLAEHLSLDPGVLDEDVFPDSGAAPALRGLVRGS